MKYVKQFDSVRAIAVILVIISHWTLWKFSKIFAIGLVGVDMFFVLSGFLITQILLTTKKQIEESVLRESKTKAIGKFMMRRVLRIFPIYYLLLFVLLLNPSFFHNPIGPDWKYYVLYLQNYLMYAKQAWAGKLTITWSLAVEEQFYLIWPWIILFTPYRYLKTLLLVIFFIGIASAITLPVILGILLKNNFTTILLTPTCLDAFCAGGMLAYIMVYKKNELPRYHKSISIIALLAFVTFIITKLFAINIFLPPRTLIALATTGLLEAILLNKTGRFFNYLLSNKALIAIGKVSYGIYLFHNFIPTGVNGVLQVLSNHKILNHLVDKIIFINQTYQPIFLIECGIVTLIVCFTSFYIYEKPIINLKRYFSR